MFHIISWGYYPCSFANRSSQRFVFWGAGGRGCSKKKIQTRTWSLSSWWLQKDVAYAASGTAGSTHGALQHSGHWLMLCVLCCAAMCWLEAAGKSLSATVLWGRGEKIVIITIWSTYFYDNALLPRWPNEITSSQSWCYKGIYVGIWMHICTLLILDMSGDLHWIIFRSVYDWNLQCVEGNCRSWEVSQGEICWETPKKMPYLMCLQLFKYKFSYLTTLWCTPRLISGRLSGPGAHCFHLLMGRDESKKNKSPVSD